MIRLFVTKTPNGYECGYQHSTEKWTGETIQDALRSFERAYIDYYGRAPIYCWQ